MPGCSTRKTYGTDSADAEANERPGVCPRARRRHAAAQYDRSDLRLGYDVTEAESGRVVVTSEPKDIHLNPAGTVQGSLAATMLDSCMGSRSNRLWKKGVGSTTLEFKISFVRPITLETSPIKAEGAVISRRRRVGTKEGRVTDNKGRLLVHGTTTCLILES